MASSKARYFRASFMTPKTKPGDQVYVKRNSFLKSVIDDNEVWSPGDEQLALVISSPVRYIELDDEITGLVMVFIANVGMYFIEENMLMTIEEFFSSERRGTNPRLHEW
jgi:hypothetical protein